MRDFCQVKSAARGTGVRQMEAAIVGNWTDPTDSISTKYGILCVDGTVGIRQGCIDPENTLNVEPFTSAVLGILFIGYII